MAPIRRYLRISKHSVLECRIFVENPADGPRWLLRTNDPALPRVIGAIRPLVLPKLREENERAKGKGKKKNRVKDVVAKDDFEVSIFLTPIGTRHCLLTKTKTFEESSDHLMPESSRRLAGSNAQPVFIREESEDEGGPSGIDRTIPEEGDGLEQDDKKKLAFKTTYEGFNIWGWVLCLLVTRKGMSAEKGGENSAGQALMEDWISTQQQQEEG